MQDAAAAVKGNDDPLTAAQVPGSVSVIVPEVGLCGARDLSLACGPSSTFSGPWLLSGNGPSALRLPWALSSHRTSCPGVSPKPLFFAAAASCRLWLSHLLLRGKLVAAEQGFTH